MPGLLHIQVAAAPADGLWASTAFARAAVEVRAGAIDQVRVPIPRRCFPSREEAEAYMRAFAVEWLAAHYHRSVEV